MRFFVCVLFFFPLAFAWSASDKKINALLVCDTDSDIRSTVKHDLEHVRTTLKVIARKTKMKLNTKTLTGSQVTTRRVRELATSLAKARGVSFFYFTGHGFRLSKAFSPWPRLTFMKKQDSMNPDTITSLLTKGHSRLTIIIFDCCNEIFSSKAAAPAGFSLQKISLCEPKRSLRSNVTSTFPKEKNPAGIDASKSPYSITKMPLTKQQPSWSTIQDLFMKTNGFVIMAAASPGEVARGSESGSFFTTSLLESLSCQKKAQNASWKEIFTDVQRRCSLVDQHPFCEIHIKK